MLYLLNGAEKTCYYRLNESVVNIVINRVKKYLFKNIKLYFYALKSV